MEGGSTRMGSRSSTRHGPGSMVFQGPVRKWRKSWAPIATTSATHASSRVLLYKWSPLTVNKDDAPEEQPSPAVRYVPVSVILARKMDEEKQEQEQEQEQEQQEQEQEDDDGGGQADMEEDKETSS